MKLISFIVPCYNSSEYMKKCIDSLLICGEDAEILIIDDGSNKDNTYEIAKEYEKKYPSVCKAIHQENAGHGGALNRGIANAIGLYVKVVDSDDYLEKRALLTLLSQIKSMIYDNQSPDLFITNYVYNKEGAIHKKVMSYGMTFPKNKLFTWDTTRYFTLGEYLLMHSLLYKTKVLRASNLILPEHTFYVDNIFAYQPLPYVQTIYYLDVNLYMYYIGRKDQSVNEELMIKRLDQQYTVTKKMLKVDIFKVRSKKLRQYMLNYMSMIMTITSVMSIRSKNEYWLMEKEKLWNDLKKENFYLYIKLKHTILGYGVNLPGKVGKDIVVFFYKAVRLIYGFN
ncbi:MAG: glycosyltransferase family 2 protein [Eubacteriales bacterium]|nr:glycosyltransferase family 2 protein [Eubacteriales bacterium]